MYLNSFKNLNKLDRVIKQSPTNNNMNWSLERIIPKGILGSNQKMRVIKEYLKNLKEEKKSKN